MPALKNPRHELFIQGHAAGLPAYKAYLQAGFKCDVHAAMVAASRLLRKADIQARLKTAMAEHAANLNVTVESLVLEMNQVIALAHEQGQASAAQAALMAKGKLLQLVVDRSESTSTINHNYAQMSEEEVLFEIASIHQELRAIKASKGKVSH